MACNSNQTVFLMAVTPVKLVFLAARAAQVTSPTAAADRVVI